MIDDFKKFLFRGNVVDLAVAVVIGTAFTAIVNAVVTGLITPLVGIIFSKDVSEMYFTVNDSRFYHGLVIDAAITFVSIAAVVFFLVVKPLNVLQERRRRGQEPPVEELSDEAALLTEIRDLLRSQAVGAPRGANPGAPQPPPNSPQPRPAEEPPSTTGW